MIDKNLYKIAAVFAAYIVALVPLYFVVGLANLHFGWRISYDTACFLLLVVAIVVVGDIARAKGKGATPP